MKQKYLILRNLRRIIQWLFFLLFFAGFLSFMPTVTSGISSFLPKLQLFNSIRRLPAAALLIMLTTFLFGRVYCSTLCPLATVQDACMDRKRKFSYRKLGVLRRYLVPAISLIALFAGLPALASIVDPYSMSGRIVSSVNELIVLPLIDLTGLVLRNFSIYITTYPIQFRWVTISISIVSMALVFIFSRIGGRLYCNTLCPVGGLLSIPARWSIFAHRINVENCTSCGACEQVCKAEAIDVSSKFIDTSKCVSCFNCSTVCKFDALKYGRKDEKYKDIGRRDFLKKTASGSILLLGLPVVARASKLPVTAARSSTVAVPPGSKSRVEFLSKCISCSLCISRCPGNVLQPAVFSQYGLKGIGVPFMDFNKGSCEFECNLCTELCPSGAIQVLELVDKKRVKIGEASFVRELCVVETDGTSCGACGEICPSGAIEMLHIGDSSDGPLEIPLINKKYCIGCGSCQFVCPVVKKDAIFVEALEPHGRAEVREKRSEGTLEEVDNDFAF